MAHGRVGLAWRSHPFGVMLFVLVMAGAIIGPIELLTDRSVLKRFRPGAWWVAALVGGMLAGWGWKLAAGHLSGKYPLP